MKKSERNTGTRGGVNKYLSITILNVNRVNAPIKRDRVVEWIRKHDPHTYCLQVAHLRTKIPIHTKSEGIKKNLPIKWTGKKAGVTKLILDRIHFKTNTMKTENEITS